MKQISFLVLLFSITCSIWAQTEENLFEWQANNEIAEKNKFLGLYREQDLLNEPPYILKEYDVPQNGKDSYKVKIATVEGENWAKDMNELRTFDSFEIYCNEKKIFAYLAGELLHDVENITMEANESPFIKVPLSDDSFALFFGGWPYDGGDAPEMVIAVVSGENAKVIYDNRALAYKYTPAPNFSIEFVETIGNLYENDPIVFTDSFLKSRTKHKIWKEGNMLKYKSWK